MNKYLYYMGLWQYCHAMAIKNMNDSNLKKFYLKAREAFKYKALNLTLEEIV